MEDIRSWWEVPSIAHFCSLFRTAFGLTDFEIEDLEEALLSDGSVDGSLNTFLGDLHARLLRGLFETKEIHADNFEPFLSQILKIRWEDELGKENPLKDKDYSKLTVQQKVEILHDLCDFRLDVADVPELLKGLDADSLRVEPLGRDSKGSIYWYFYGTRLYKEVPVLSQEEKEKKKLLKNKKKLAAKKKQRKKKKAKAKRKKRKGASSDSDSDFVTSSDSSEDITSEEEEEEDNIDSESEEDSTKTGWSLICSLASEWEALAESFKKSKNRDERLLYQTLSEDFVPEIEKMIEAKEKAYQKKLLELAPRRASTRIAIKMSMKEEDEREEEEEKQKEKERLAEEKRLEQEEKQKEKERLAEKRQHERAERARLREERQWMRMNGEIPPELMSSVNGNEEHKEEDTQRKERVPEFEGDDDRDEDLYTGMYKVLDYLKKHNNAWPFLEPVDESYAPQYHEIIEHPMDLSTIEEKLDKGEYKTLDEFQNDMQLMFDNCEDYNGPDSMYTKMANTLKAAFERQIKKHFPEDEDNSDEDFEEELRKGRKKEREKENKMKPRKAEFSIDDFITSKTDTRSPNKTMGSMPYSFMNEMGMNRVPNPMMATRRPQDFQFPQGVAPGFGPDGRPVYPPQFYQNYYNATMARLNIPQQRQFEQYQYQPPPLTRAPMTEPQRMGYPQQSMPGHIPFGGPSPNGMTPPGLQRMQVPNRMGIPLGAQAGPGAVPPRPHMQGHQPRQQMMPESSRTPTTSQSSSPSSQGSSSASQPGQHAYPDQFRPNPMGLPTRPEQLGMQMPPSRPGQFPSYSGMNGSQRLQRAQMEQMAQQRMGDFGPNMPRSYGVRPPGSQLPPGFMPSSQGPPKSQTTPTTSVPSSTGTSSSTVTSPGSENEGKDKKSTEEDSTSLPLPKTIPPVSTSAEPTPASLTAEKDKREPEQAIPMSRPQSFGQPFPPQPYYGRPMAPYPQGLPHGYPSVPQERHTSVIMPPAGPPSLTNKNKSLETVRSDTDKSKDPITNERTQEAVNKEVNQSDAKSQKTPTPPNIAPKETTDQSSKTKGVGLSISHILGSSPRDTSGDSPRSSENKPPVITATRRSPPPLVSDRKRLEDMKNKKDSNRSSPAVESPSQSLGNQQERVPGHKNWPLEQGPSQASPRQGSPSLGPVRQRGFLEELFNGKPPASKDVDLPSDPLTQGSQRLPFTSLLKEIAPPQESPNKKGPFVALDSTSQETKSGLNLGGMNQAHKDFMTRNYLRDQDEVQRFGPLAKQMNPYGMYPGNMGPDALPPLSYRPQGQEMSSIERQRALQMRSKRTPDGQFVDLAAMQYREQPGYPSREQLFLMEQRRQQERMASSRSSVIGGDEMHMMGYPGNVMLHQQQQQQQFLQAMYGNRMRNGEFPNFMSEDVPTPKIPRFS